MQTLADYIEEKKDVIDTLIKTGELSTTLVFRYEIHQYFNRLPDNLGRMDRYENTAAYFKIGDRAVRKALAIMNKKVNPIKLER